MEQRPLAPPGPPPPNPCTTGATGTTAANPHVATKPVAELEQKISSGRKVIGPKNFFFLSLCFGSSRVGYSLLVGSNNNSSK
ncbi:hypothetical protein Hanom_Chr14g01265541 [Helianthus anomalus]